MSFEQEINEWINLDNEIKRLTEHITKLKDRKTSLHDKLVSYAKHFPYPHGKLSIPPILNGSLQASKNLFIGSCCS